MTRLPQKARFQCPGCGFSQFEPPQLISTYCQSCGDYYEVHPSGSCNPLALSVKPRKPDGGHRINCHRCGASHQVSSHARNTLCPSCNAAIDLCDVVIPSPTSRQIDTRGKLLIARSGSLSSSWIVCGAAHIEGRITGVLKSEGAVHLSTNLSCVCQIAAPTVIIEKNARAKFTLPVETGHLEVRGHLTGIVRCRGIVHVRRGGRLEAEVHARAVRVDKGGALVGACHVDGTQPSESEGRSVPGAQPLWSVPLCPAC